MASSRVILAALAVVINLCAVGQASAQFENLARQLPGTALELILRNGTPANTKGTVTAPPAVSRVPAIPAEECRNIQSALSALGFAVGTVDGQCGPRSLGAIADFQRGLGASPTGQLTQGQRQALFAQAQATQQKSTAPATVQAQTTQTAPAAAQAALTLGGRWEGSYLCGQGLTAAVMTLDDAGKGTFQFGPHETNRGIPKGEYAVAVSLSDDGSIVIEPGRWIDRPSGYRTVQMEGRMTESTMTGKLLESTCKGFELTRVAADAAPAQIAQAPTPAPVPAPSPAPAPAPAPAPEPSDAEIDCSALIGASRSDCDVFRQQATTVFFNEASAVPAIARSCRALAGAFDEAALVECLAGAYAARNYVKLPDALFAGGWKGLGPVLAGATTCQSLVTRIRDVSSAVTGDPATTGNAPQAQCQQLAMLAMARQTRLPWGGCAMGTDPTLVHLECLRGEPSHIKSVWRQAVANCAAGKQPDMLNRRLTEDAAAAGRDVTALSCTDVDRLALSDGILDATEIAATRQQVADEAAAAAERQRAAEAAAAEKQRQEQAAAEQARQRAEAQRLADIAAQQKRAADNAANPVYGSMNVPQQYEGIARSIESGEVFTFNDASMLFTAGVTSELLEKCSISINAGARVELAAFAGTAALQAAGGNQYNNPDIGKMMADQVGSAAVFTAGSLAARSLQCVGGDVVLENIADIVRRNKSGAGGGPAPFIASCTPVHGSASCTCLAELGRSSYSNIYQMQYSRDLVYGIISANPMTGLMVAMSCGIQNY